MTYREVMLSISGLRARDKMHEGWLRRVTFIIGATNFGGKEVSRRFDRFWPDPYGDGKTINVSERAIEQLRKFRENEAMRRAKQKISDGRTETLDRRRS